MCMFCVLKDAANKVASDTTTLSERSIQLLFMMMEADRDTPVENLFLKYLEDDTAAKIRERAELFPRLPPLFFVNRAIELFNAGDSEKAERVMADFGMRWADREIIEWMSGLDKMTQIQMLVNDTLVRTAVLILVERGLTKETLNGLRNEVINEDPLRAAELGITGDRNFVQGNTTVN
ncbi:hypothetical protein [Stenotrophomonas sp. GD03657]|uniref:hypothetical protein n=1 Tax=Stenotrophomonas sp. GD03657 TaxID=2975363 RepID=UPI00244CBEEE|nr:hypothetical protein [Stenotrophomonas sp. GD03657]MDH2154215.1 hypothetical protein [Stenotrophomonas sp. GD03657]